MNIRSPLLHRGGRRRGQGYREWRLFRCGGAPRGHRGEEVGGWGGGGGRRGARVGGTEPRREREDEEMDLIDPRKCDCRLHLLKERNEGRSTLQ